MKNFNLSHPECEEDEVFVANADDVTWKEIGWKTKRKGEVAYVRDGSPVGHRWPGSFPVFVKRQEIIGVNPDILKMLEDLSK